MFEDDSDIQYFMRIQERRHQEWQDYQDRVAKARKARGRKIKDDELVELLVDVRQLGGERVPDAVKIIQRLVDAPGDDPATATVATALLEQIIHANAEDHRRYHSDDIRDLIREFKLRDLRSEHLLTSRTGYWRSSNPVHICRTPRSKRHWWKPSWTLCHQRAGKFEIAERGEWAASDYRRCGYCEAKTKKWEHIAECYEEPADVEFDDPGTIDEEAIELGSEHLQQAVVEIRAGVIGCQDAAYSRLDKYLLDQIAEDAWDQAARRVLTRALVDRGDQPLLDSIKQREAKRGGHGFWSSRLSNLYEQLPVGKDRLVDLLGPDALYKGCTVNDLLNHISYALSERAKQDDETFEQRQTAKRLKAEETERENLRRQIEAEQQRQQPQTKTKT